MVQFINKWKKLDIKYAQSLKITDQDGFVIDVPDLRKLTMDSEDDIWFV